VKSIKTLGIATAMALALISFAGASAASANLFQAPIAPTTWNGSLTGKSHALSLNGESYTCSGVSFSGEVKNKTTNEVTVTPQLSCTRSTFPYAAAWAMHGCKYRFHPGTGPSLVGSIDIVGCETPMSTETGEGCRVEIGNQSGLGTVTYKNVATSPTTVTAVASLTGLTFTRSGPCTGPKGTFSNGTYTGEWTIKGASIPSGAPVAVEVESSVAPFTHFSAEEAPVTIAGVGTGTGSQKRFSGLGGFLVWCSSYTLSGTSASATPEAMTVIPAYSGCTFGLEGPPATVSAGECSYVLHANGNIDIAGANCASKPITITVPGCVYTFGPQSGFSGNKFTNEGSGKLRAVSVSGLPTGLTYTRTGASCEGGAGTFNTGQLFNVAKLSATNSKGASQGISIE
jgi:hypothetical protein